MDVYILKALLKDARTSFTDIAQDCGVSTYTIVQRFYKMKEAGVITGSVIRLNMKKFKKNYVVVIDVDVEQKEVDHIIDCLTNLPCLVSCYKLLGKHDVHASLLTESLEEIDQIRDMIKVQKGVKKVWISNSLDVVGCFPENLVIKPTENRTNG
ncbi:MAG: Lrp/AsnC family transcriptional regulator [Candidatus Bathyarchaeota archaeon]|nr:Lrp/AsnC family transcriptional regulator [Candidatus Bathyarchaeum sp.]